MRKLKGTGDRSKDTMACIHYEKERVAEYAPKLFYAKSRKTNRTRRNNNKMKEDYAPKDAKQ